MIVLGIESATSEVGAAIVTEVGLLAEVRARPGRRHVETLHPAIEAVTAIAGVTLEAIEVIAVDVGPGLFTGLRVGIAAAKALAFGLGIPTVAVLSTEALGHAQRGVAERVLAVVDLRRGELAWQTATARYDFGTLHHGPPEELFELGDKGLRGALVVGDGALRHAGVLGALGGTVLDREDSTAPSAATVATIGHARAVAGQSSDAFSLEACYLRPADARVNFHTRHSPAGAGSR